MPTKSIIHRQFVPVQANSLKRLVTAWETKIWIAQNNYVAFSFSPQTTQSLLGLMCLSHWFRIKLASPYAWNAAPGLHLVPFIHTYTKKILGIQHQKHSQQWLDIRAVEHTVQPQFMFQLLL